MFEQSFICKLHLLAFKFFSYLYLGQIAHEMDMICQSEETVKAFEDDWKKYSKIFLSYSKSIPFQTKELRKVLEDVDRDPNGMFEETRIILY